MACPLGAFPEGVVLSVPAGVRVFEASDRTPEIRRRLFRVLASRPDGVLAIGSIAARLARETIFGTPFVYTLVLDADRI